MPETFSATLRRIRKSAKLTQQQLADAAGVHVYTVKRYESGKLVPGLDVAERLAVALGKTLDVWSGCNWTG